MSKQDVAIGVAAGVAIAALAPLAILIVGGSRGSLMRALSRGGKALSEKAQETFAELQEITEDFVAEMRAPNEAVAASGAATTASSSLTPATAQSNTSAEAPKAA